MIALFASLPVITVFSIITYTMFINIIIKSHIFRKMDDNLESFLSLYKWYLIILILFNLISELTSLLRTSNFLSYDIYGIYVMPLNIVLAA